MVAKPREPCYTVSRIRIEGQEAYEGWKTASAPRVAEAYTGGSVGGTGRQSAGKGYTMASQSLIILPGGHEAGRIPGSGIFVDDIGPGARSGGRSIPPGPVRMAEAFHGLFSGGFHILPGLWDISWKLDSRHIRIPFGNGAGMGL